MEFLDCKNEIELINYFQKIGIIGTKAPLCKKCNVSMKWGNKSDNIDKFSWKCNVKGCGTSLSIRNGSFLETFNKDLHTFLKMVYHWAMRTPHKQILKELQVSRNFITAWQQKFRLIAIQEFDKDNVILGGTNEVIEIDESLFIKVKHHKGKDLARPQVWVFGMYERESKKCLFIVVPKRDAFTLLNVIYKHIAPNSIIHSDCWSAYCRIRKLDKNFSHRTVNHDLYFVDPKTGVHTNGVESIWGACKIPIKAMRGISRDYLSSYLDEFCWRRLYKDEFEVFEQMLCAISRRYPPSVTSTSVQLENLAHTMSNLSVKCVSEIFDVVENDDSTVPEFPDYEIESSVVNDVESTVDEPIAAVSAVESSVDEQISASTKLIDDVFNKLKNGDINSFTFPSTLSIEERHKVHELSETLKIYHLTSGTRYKRITVSKTQIEKKLTTSRHQTSNLLQKLASPVIPNNIHVSEIVTASNDKPKGTGRGRKKLNIVSENPSRYNLRKKK